MCTLDFLDIYDDQRHWRICGDWGGRQQLLYFVFNSSTINVKFTSNNSSTRPGFTLNWASTVEATSAPHNSCMDPLLETESACFELMREGADWLTGHNTCRMRGATLAHVDSVDTHLALEREILERNVSAVWIGAHDRLYEGDFMWTDRSAINFHNWFPGWIRGNLTVGGSQPSDDGWADEDCVEMRRLFALPDKGTGFTETYFWNDRNCDVRNPFVCQYDKLRGRGNAKPQSNMFRVN
ncbi:macrophage mannose receptor 1-like [Mya arenaria]|uniref:macrophage mannose receptor 1-like n=1 Tax=Mya arenaria TaxID=6604 RepID=UPI0022E15569|nr:macrophage mannose receptor 1-like [Mya arenaria]